MQWLCSNYSLSKCIIRALFPSCVFYFIIFIYHFVFYFFIHLFFLSDGVFNVEFYLSLQICELIFVICVIAYIKLYNDNMYKNMHFDDIDFFLYLRDRRQ